MKIDKNSNFFKFFPPPSILKMPAVGLSIGKDTIKFVELIKGNDGLVLGKSEEIRISSKILEKENRESLKKILVSLKEKNSLEFVRLIISEDNSYLFIIRLPKVRKEEIRGSIELQLEEYVPIPVKNAVFDYQIIRESDRGRGYIDLVVTVLPKDLIIERVELFKEVGLIPLSVENKAQAIARAVIPKDHKEAVMIVDSGENMTGIYIVSQGVVHFTSVIQIGGGLLTDTIKKALNVSTIEAEKIKREKGISTKEENIDLFTILLPIISTLRDEINKNYIYWHTHEYYGANMEKKEKIQKIILCGGNSNLIGLDEYLASSLKIEVERANVWTNVNSFNNYIPRIDFQDSLKYTASIGLALYDK